MLAAEDSVAAALRYWVGDVVGILVLAPLALFALTRRRVLPMSMETALQGVAVVCALVLVFGIAEEREFQLFYALFLPVVWMAVRNGAEGVSVGILLELAQRLNERSYARPVILITGHGDVDMAVAAIKNGAFDFIEKPFDEERKRRRRTGDAAISVQRTFTTPAPSHGACGGWAFQQGNRHPIEDQPQDRR
jgi:ActR/RegA family two-component response regulator